MSFFCYRLIFLKVWSMYLRFFCLCVETNVWLKSVKLWVQYLNYLYEKRSVLPNSKWRWWCSSNNNNSKLWLHSIVWVVCFGSFKSSWWAVVHWALRRSSTYRHSVQQCDITNGPALIMYVNCMATTSLFKRTLDPKFVVLLHNIVLAILTK